MIRIQGQNRKIYAVTKKDDGIYECECSGFLTHGKRCFHTEKAQEYLERKFHRYRFDVTSSFHKEVRRGDRERGLTWALIMKRTQGATRVRDYCKGIVFEETRNVVLYDIYKNRWNEFDRIDLADMIIRSKKRWMGDPDHNCYEHQVNGYIKQAGKRRFTPEQIRKTIVTSDDIEDWYAVAFSVCRYADDGQDQKVLARKWFKDAVEERLRSSKPVANRDEVLVLLGGSLGLHSGFALCEIATGHWDRTMNEIDEPSEEYKKPNFIPRFEEYIYDCHSFEGKRRLYKHWFDIQPMTRMPDKVDMRWSGMMYGLQWRFDAYRQHGTNDLRNVEWHKTDIRPDLWERTKRLDAWFYKQFYGSVHTIHWRLDDDPIFPTIVEDNDWDERLVKPDKTKSKGDAMLMKKMSKKIKVNEESDESPVE